jgi:hypothetical protein
MHPDIPVIVKKPGGCMTRDAFVDELLNCAKRHWDSFWSQLPDEHRLRLSSMESELGAITQKLQRGLWALVAERLDELSWELEGRCGGCGYRRERRSDQIEVDLLGHRVTFPCSYLYCRRCHQGVNPVRRWLGVEQGGVSIGLERAVTDLTTRMTFGDAMSSMAEHHGREMDRTKAERVSYQVGEQATEYLAQRRKKARDALLSGEGTMEEQLVFAADGGMIPVGEFSRPPKDEVGPKTPKTPVRNLAKGTRTIAGREARLIAVHPAQNREKRVVDIHIAPYEDTAYTGERMVAAAAEAGLRDQSRIHGVFDMGSWIHTQFETQFDTYEKSACADIAHVADYLIDAGRVINGADGAAGWGMMQKRRLLDGQFDTALADLEAHECTADCTSDDHPKCRAAIARRYLKNHPDYMNCYAEIRSRDLPVGSGEAESGVRHLIKRRLSIAGAWTEEHADLMLALITIRASGWWDDFWRWRDQRDLENWHKRQRGDLRSRFRAHQAATTEATA